MILYKTDITPISSNALDLLQSCTELLVLYSYGIECYINLNSVTANMNNKE